MADSKILKELKTLEQEVADFVEEEVEEIEGKKTTPQYADSFKGDILGKHDPYEKDDEEADHAAHKKDAEVPKPPKDAKWFKAVKKSSSHKKAHAKEQAKKLKKKAAAEKKAAAKVVVGKDNAQAQKKHLKSKEDDEEGTLLETEEDKEEKLQPKDSSNIDDADDEEGGGNSAAAEEDEDDDDADDVDDEEGGGDSAGAEEDEDDDDDADDVDGEEGGGDSAGAEEDEDDDDDADDVDGEEGGGDSVGAEEDEDDDDDADDVGDEEGGGDSVGAEEDEDDDDDADDVGDEEGGGDSVGAEEDEDDDDDASSDQTRTSERIREEKHRRIHRREVARKKARARRYAEEEKREEERVFHQKSRILRADLDDLAQKGKESKEKKEVLRGLRRTIENPHKVFRNPHRLRVMRSGNHERIYHHLKRYGRQVESREDVDTEDLSSNPELLAEVRRNHRLAMRHMIDVGNQYGSDPFDGVAPGDVEEIIDHHAKQHPYRRKSGKYTAYASKSIKQLHRKLHERYRREEGLAEESVSDDGSEEYREVAREHYDIGDEARYRDEGDGVDERYREYGPQEGDGREDESYDESASPDYPQIDEAEHRDESDYVESARRLTRRRRLNKRDYPQPYVQEESPQDLQLAYDQLAARYDEESAYDENDGDEEDGESAQSGQRLAAVKKMIGTLHKIRSFQSDPHSWEKAFVDDAEESGAEVEGYTPRQLHEKYNILKKVHRAYYEKRYPNRAYGEQHRSSPEKFMASGGSASADEPQVRYDEMTDREDAYEFQRSDSSYGSNSTRENEAFTAEEQYQEYEEQSPRSDRYESAESRYDPNQGYGPQSYESHDYARDEVTSYSGERSYSRPNNYIDGSAQYGNSQQWVDGAYGAQSPDVQMELPSNQFPGADVYPQQEGTQQQMVYQEGDGVDEGDGSGQEDAAPGLNIQTAVEGVSMAVQSAVTIERGLSDVEKVGSEAERASKDLKNLENAKGDFAKMANLCSNPVDSLTQGDNVLSMVGELAEHPDDIANAADALISKGPAGLAALVADPNDPGIMVMVGSLVGGEQPEEEEGLDEEGEMEIPEGDEGEYDAYQQQMMVGQMEGANADEEGYPAELQNEAMYGDYYE